MLIKKRVAKEWTGRLQAQYADFDEFVAYDEMYGLAERLGYASAEEAWEDNPMVAGSTNPAEYRRIDKRVRRILNKVERVRVGQWYSWNPNAWDTLMATTPETENLPVGTRVKVINLHGAPKANTMGHCYIENEAGEFLGMVSVHSLDKI